MFTSNGYVLDEREHRLGVLEPVPEHERSSRALLRERLDAHGYLYLRNQLDPAVIMDFREHYFSRLAGTGLIRTDHRPADGIAAPAAAVDRAAVRHVLFSDIVPGPEYARLCSNPRIRDWFAWFLGGEVHLHRRKIIRHTRPDEHLESRTKGVGSATQAHYDLLYLRQGSDHVLSMWIPLGPCPRELGGLVYLEGSHRWVQADEASGRAKRPAASITADLPALADTHGSRWLWADYAAGDVVVHTAHTVHAALDNLDREGRIRLSTDIRYQRSDEPIDQRWQHDWHDRDGL